MCGRYTLALLPDHLSEIFRVHGRLPAPRFNIAPSQLAPVIGRNPKSGERSIVEMEWGLVPTWRKSASTGRLINARAETVSSKPTFRKSLQSKRCIVPASGFYEWHREAGGKQPYYFTLKSGEPMGLAGLWAKGGDGDGTENCYTIITTAANELLAHIHDRMPVILPPDCYEAWLDDSLPAEAMLDLLKPYPADQMEMRPVSKAINRADVDGESLIAVVPSNSA